jgi:hypothetical protein
METVSFSETLYVATSPHGVTTQKTNIDIFTAVKVSFGLKHMFTETV